MKRGIKIGLISIFQMISSVLSLFVLYVTYMLFGILIPFSGEDQKDDISIYVRSNGVHTDVCLPVQTPIYDWTSFIDTQDYPLNRSFEFIAAGWGDKGFYIETETWDDLKATTALNAIFTPSPCAMHMEYLDYEPADNEYCAEVKLSAANYGDMVDYIVGTFELNNGKPDLIPNASYFGTDHFYEAKGNYHLFQTCNSWTNGALKSAQIRTASWAILPSTIISYLKK